MLAPFVRRRHRLTRVVLFSLLLAVLPALVLGQYLVDMVRDLRHDWPKLRRDIRELYCDCWRTPRDKNAK